MKAKAIYLTLLLTIMLLAAGTFTTTFAGDDEGTRDSRATPIDGEHEDMFLNANNLTMTKDVGVIDGAVIVDRAVLRDNFGRFPLAPWTAEEGTPRIIQGVLNTNASMESNSTAKVSMDLDELELTFDFSPGLMMMNGPVLVLEGQGEYLWVAYKDGAREVHLGVRNSTGEYTLNTGSANMETDEWYTFRMVVSSGTVDVEMGPATMGAAYSFLGKFISLSLTSLPLESAAWDNVTLNKLGGSGRATTDVVDLPLDTMWEGLHINYDIPAGTQLDLALLDGAGAPIPGLDDITSGYLNLRDRVDPTIVGAVQLRADLVAEGTYSPSIYSWKVTWKGDPPKFIKPLPKVTLNEDEAQYGVVDLREHFEDRFTEGENLTFTVPWVNDSTHVYPVVDGHMLGFELPTTDWFGTEIYKVRCSDGVLTVDSVQTEVVVMPVDDPPTVRPFGRVDMYEDEEYQLDLGPYLEDVDTQVQFLKIRETSDHASVNGHVITLNYDMGGTDRIELEVSDDNNFVIVIMDITIREVDDPPVIAPFDPIVMYEDQVETVDVSLYLSDEDDLVEDLLVDIVDGDEYISIDGQVITLLFFDTGGDFEYVILVSDENSTVNRVLEVDVQEVNDPPEITMIGTVTPLDGEVSLSITEGDTADLPIVVEDEESSIFQYVLITDFEGATITSGVLELVTTVGQVGTEVIQISVSDGTAAAFVKIYLEIVNRNDPPQDLEVIAPADGANFTEGDMIPFTGYAFDPDTAFGQVLTFNWSSDINGSLGAGKTLEVDWLAVGTHTITLTVDDGEFTETITIGVVIDKKNGGGNNGGPNNGNGGGSGGGGLSTTLMVIILVAVLAVVGVMFFVMKGRGGVSPEAMPPMEPPEKEGEEAPIPPAAAAYDEPTPAPVPDYETASTMEETAEAAEHPPPPVQAPTEEPPTSYALDFEPAQAPTPAVEVTGGVGTVTLESIMGEEDPEQKALDERKRRFQATISSLPYGVPSSDLAGMDWYELAAALASAEEKELDDGRTVSKIGDNWFYSDTEDIRTFLKKHE
jgi:hypothetical protein